MNRRCGKCDLGVWALCLSLLALACSREPDQDPEVDPRLLQIRGDGLVWLASTESPIPDPKQPENRELIEIDGKITALDEGELRPPTDWRAVYGGQHSLARRVVTLRSDAGVDWKLGYRLTRDDPKTDVTPLAPIAVGATVHLRFRAIWAFGTAAAFVLSDAQGVALAIDLAVYGDPLKPGDVPGLDVREGALLGILKGNCGDQRYADLTFAADAAIDVRQNQTRLIAIGGKPYTAFHLFNFNPVPDPTRGNCPDVTNEGRAWAIWRNP
jgi:hypothetical protein